MHLNYHPLAEAEVIASARFYDQRAPGLGADFLDSVDAAAREIQRAPARWPTVREDVRKCPLRRFPFTLYFRICADHVRILAVSHQRRRPAYWRSRLND